jgi:hypothetical protein
MAFNQAENFRQAILKRKARVAEIESALGQVVPPSKYGSAVRVSLGSRQRLEEEKLHELEVIADLGKQLQALDIRRANEQTAKRDTLFELPGGLRASGDPVSGNPFSRNDYRHVVWDKATLGAEEELRKFHSDILRVRVVDADVGSISWVMWMCDLVVGKFDIWAKRGIYVVWGDSAVLAYDEWLFNYAQAWLNEFRNDTVRMAILMEGFVLELRLRLIERMEWWKAEARRYVADQKANVTKKTLKKARTKESKQESAKRNLFDAAPDYRSICFRGKRHTLTRNQSKIIGVLHKALLAGHPDVSKDKLLSAIESETSQVRDSFRRSPLWKTLVTSPRLGVYRLNL